MKLERALGKDTAGLVLLLGAGHGDPACEAPGNVLKGHDWLDQRLRRACDDGGGSS
jgi:hypothetical protein